MRGKVSFSQSTSDDFRITPTYAGKRKRNPNGMLQSKDHPRLCGEKHVLCFSRTASPGSPPPMRGKVRLALICHFSLRITPAYAGKSTAEANTIRATKDHPRLCGEKFLTTEKINLMLGSPPPMRGKVEMRW